MPIRKIIGPLTLAYAMAAGGAAAQEAEVRAAMNETLASWAAGDFTAFATFYDPGARGFLLDGGMLVEGIDPAALRMGYEAGIRADFTVRELDVRMVDGVALSAAYLDGSITLPGGAERRGSWRYTDARVKEGDTWKVVQYHFSDLTARPR